MSSLRLSVMHHENIERRYLYPHERTALHLGSDTLKLFLVYLLSPLRSIIRQLSLLHTLSTNDIVCGPPPPLRGPCLHYTSNIFVFSPDGTIIHETINTPGSWHDAVVSRDLFEALLHRTPPAYWLIGDTAFPTSKELAGCIKTPAKMNFSGYPDPDE